MDKFDISRVTTYQAGAAQAAMHRLMQKKSDEILKPFGITKMQWLIIGHVYDAGKAGLRISDLSELLGTTIPYVINTVNLLESKGILQRQEHASDGRAKQVVIQPSFKKQCAKIERALRDGLRKDIYSKIDPAEFRTYLKVMYELKVVGEEIETS